MGLAQVISTAIGDKAARRFLARVQYQEDCIIWVGARAKGYGELRLGGKYMGAHRLAYEATYGTIPPGLEIDHLCRNKACVNPKHLEAVTHKVNVQRAYNNTHCPKGHPYYIRPDNGRRACRECNRANARQYYWRTKL